MLKRESENISKQPRDLLKNRLSNSLNKSQVTPSQGMLERGDDDSDDVDDEVRITVWSQNHATATQCSEESFLRTQYL